MEIIKPTDHQRITQLRRGDIAFPDIDYSGDPPLNRQGDGTIQGMYTTVQGQVSKNHLEGIDWNDMDMDANRKRIVNIITEEVKGIDLNNLNDCTDSQLERLFVLIQLWGGIGGRTPFVRGNGWPDNFNVNSYREGVNSILNNNILIGLDSFENLFGVSTAFSTKHLYFWSKHEYPVYDSILSKIVAGRKVPKRRIRDDYQIFLTALEQLKQLRPGTTNQSIERNLFNWANTPEGKKWSAIRCQR